MSNLKLLASAERFVFAHRNGATLSRDEMMRQAIYYLTTQHQCSPDTAAYLAPCAVANIESNGIDAYIDIDHSTSRCLFVRVNGQLRSLGIADLVSVLELDS